MIDAASLAADIARDGFRVAPAVFPSAAAGALVAHLKARPVWNAHVIPQSDRVARPFADGLALEPGFLCHAMADLVAAPHFVEFVLPFTAVAEAYFGEPALLYSLNAFWKTPRGGPGWHYDKDDRKQLVLFMYGSPIYEDDAGTHKYLRFSHRKSREELAAWHDVPGAAPPDEDVATFVGPPGFCFLTDTGGLHNGLAPMAGGGRLLLWARWGVSDPPASYVHDEIAPVDARLIAPRYMPPKALRDASRLVLDWSQA